MKVYCAGIFPLKIVDGKLYGFLCHPTQGSFYDYGRYGIAKGHTEEGETEKETSYREFSEETGIDNIEEIADCVGSYKVSSKGSNKTVTCYFYLMKDGKDIDPKTCFSNMTKDSFGNDIPENDRYSWFDMEVEAEDRIFGYQRPLIDFGVQLVKGLKDDFRI